MRVFAPTFEEWQDAPWRDDLLPAIREYIARSGEEIDFEEVWVQMHAVLFGAPGLLLLVAEEDGALLSYGLFRLQPGTRMTGLLCFVWQIYVAPRHGYRLPAIYAAGWPMVEEWARQNSVSRYVLLTNRIGAGYTRLLQRLGFEPYALIYSKTTGGR